MNQTVKPVLFGLVLFAASLVIPAWQANAPVQQHVFQNVLVNTTPQASTVSCSSLGLGRNTLAVHNAVGSGGQITVTGELRTVADGPNVTSGYLAVNGLAANSASNDVSPNTDPGGAFCRITATSQVTSVITVTLRRE